MVEAYALAGTTMTILVPGEVTGGAFTVLHVIKPTGCSTPPHSHDVETEVPYVLSGTLGVETEGHSIAVAAGSCIVLAPARPHRLFNESGAPVHEFLLCTPAYFDRFVAAAGTPVEPYAQPTPMTGEDRQRLVTLAPEFGIQLLSTATPRDHHQSSHGLCARNARHPGCAHRRAGPLGPPRHGSCAAPRIGHAGTKPHSAQFEPSWMLVRDRRRD